MRRFLAWLLFLLVLALVVLWLMSKPVVRFTLGPADEVIAEPGIDAFLLRLPNGSWHLHTSHSRTPDDALVLPEGVIGRPALQTTGSVLAMTPEGLLWVHAEHPVVPGGEQKLLCERASLPDDARLEGTVGGKDALLSSPVGGARALFICPGSPLAKPALFQVIDREGVALVPGDAPLVTARAVRALAFLGERGWEAWTLGESGLAQRALAEGCLRPGAIFTPDGRFLVVPGQVDGLYLLSLEENQMRWMCEGNLGVSRRVAQSWAFRHDPLRLTTSQWDLDDWLQIVDVHVPGPRSGFSAGGAHHYGVALSEDGRTLAYVQATFDEQGDEPFVEDLYLFEYDRVDAGGEQIDSRRGGRARQGPAFIGSRSSLVYIAGGEAVRVDVRPASAAEIPPSDR